MGISHTTEVTCFQSHNYILSHFLILLVQIFLPGSQTPTNMSFLLVHIQHLANCRCKAWIDLTKTFCTVLVCCALTDSKFLRCLTYRCICLNDITGDFHCPFFDIIFQKETPQNTFLQFMKYFERL